jgi:hypothetical protein
MVYGPLAPIPVRMAHGVYRYWKISSLINVVQLSSTIMPALVVHLQLARVHAFARTDSLIAFTHTALSY